LKLIEIRVPKLGMDTIEARVGNWLVAEGSQVQIGTPLVELESEKTTFALESEAAGTLAQIVQPVGAMVPIGEILGTLEID
jgi:pyruvate/2-oxoglutarate dehydrogenase complex dihydrolipoamide acyltransferase (E2) component